MGRSRRKILVGLEFGKAIDVVIRFPAERKAAEWLRAKSAVPHARTTAATSLLCWLRRVQCVGFGIFVCFVPGGGFFFFRAGVGGGGVLGVGGTNPAETPWALKHSSAHGVLALHEMWKRMLGRPYLQTTAKAFRFTFGASLFLVSWVLGFGTYPPLDPPKALAPARSIPSAFKSKQFQF